MKYIFIDTNVIIDFLSDRQPFSDDAAILFQLAKEKKIKIFVSAISFNNTYYVLRKYTSHQQVLKLLIQLEKYICVQAIDGEILRSALISNFKDFEDAIQYYSALKVGEIDVITTRNLKDFRNSDLPVLSPQTTIKYLLNNF